MQGPVFSPLPPHQLSEQRLCLEQLLNKGEPDGMEVTTPRPRAFPMPPGTSGPLHWTHSYPPFPSAPASPFASITANQPLSLESSSRLSSALSSQPHLPEPASRTFCARPAASSLAPRPLCFRTTELEGILKITGETGLGWGLACLEGSHTATDQPTAQSRESSAASKGLVPCRKHVVSPCRPPL